MSVGRVDSVQVLPSRLTPGGVTIKSFTSPGLAAYFDGTQANAIAFLQTVGLSAGAAAKAVRQGNEVFGIVVGLRTVATQDTPNVSVGAA